MNSRVELSYELAAIAAEIFNKLAAREDVPKVANINLNLYGARLEIQMGGSNDIADIARWAELFETNVVIENNSHRFPVEVICDAYDYPVQVWTALDFRDAVKLFARLGLNVDEKRHALTVQQLRELAAEAVVS